MFKDKKGSASNSNLTAAFLISWLCIFLTMRLFCSTIYHPPHFSLIFTILNGVLWDLISFGIVWFLWLMVFTFIPYLKNSYSIKYYSLTLILILATLLSVVNALFISWAHVPIEPVFFIYITSTGSLLASAKALLPKWYIAGLIFSAFFGIITIFWFYCYRKIWQKKHIGDRAISLIFLMLLLLSISCHYYKDATKSETTVSENPIWHFLNVALNKPEKLNGYEKLDMKKFTNFARKVLIKDEGDYKYIDENYPLMKYNTSFSKTQNRRDISALTKDKKPNIFILFMESMRAKEIGTYGAKEELTPTFDKLAQKGWLWENFYANGVQTPRGALAALASVYPTFDPTPIARSNPSMPLLGLGTILKNNGYETEFQHNGSIAFDNKIPFFKNLGFDTILGMEQLDPDNKYDHNDGWGFGDVIFAKLLAERLNKQPVDNPLFLLAFTVSTHHPWIIPEPSMAIYPVYSDNEYERYRNCVHYTDIALKELFDNLSDDALNNTIFILLADTSAPMGEHDDNFVLIVYLYEENVRIPFLIYAPGFIKEGRRFKEIASQVDITPTILDMLNIKTLNTAVGRSLLAEPVNEPYAISTNPFFLQWISIRQSNYHLFFSLSEPRGFLFDVEKDPYEKNDLYLTEQDIALTLRKKATLNVVSSQLLIETQRIWNADKKIDEYVIP
ncbi:arylsulfatase [Candidatus Magnetoovum chiemensis]|nr:arylsulfatase [Candidatus Magnetoovum chiemensis]